MSAKGAMGLTYVVIFAIVLVAMLAGCDPAKGQPCDHKGDISSHNGVTLKCAYKDKHLVWQ